VVQRQTLAELLRRAGVDAEVASRFGRNSSSLRAERITTSGRGGSGNVNIIFAMVVSLLLYTTILMYGQTMLRGVIEEKQTRVAEVVVSSIRPTTLLAGKVLGVGAVGLTQMLIWLACSWVMLHYRLAVLAAFGKSATPLPLPSITAPMLALLLLFFLLGYLLYSTLFAMVGAMVSTETEAQQAQLPVVLLLVASIIFLMPVLNAPDGRLAVTLGMLPVTSPIVMPLRMSAVDVPTWEVVLSLFALVAGCYLGVYVAARVYRTGLLLYGKRATMREIARWVREAR
jgi:ABC-2 type transport system permease protein